MSRILKSKRKPDHCALFGFPPNSHRLKRRDKQLSILSFQPRCCRRCQRRRRRTATPSRRPRPRHRRQIKVRVYLRLLCDPPRRSWRAFSPNRWSVVRDGGAGEGWFFFLLDERRKGRGRQKRERKKNLWLSDCVIGSVRPLVCAHLRTQR